MKVKLNQRQQTALTALKRLIQSLEDGTIIELKEVDTIAIKEVFGFELKSERFLKNIKTFVKGKDCWHYQIAPGKTLYDIGIRKHYHFPFQIKEMKKK
jgi:predicted AAA+ superfamily ATPase